MINSKIDNGLVIKKIGKEYAGRYVVSDISLKLKKGEIIGLLGPNGAGKTTSFYMISGLVKPDYGQIFLDQEDITSLPLYRRARLGIGYLPQESSIFRGLNVEENILAVLEIFIKDQYKIKQKLEDLLSEFSITHIRHTQAISLSGGERRRVEIARCLAASPKFMLLDEPFAGVDPIAVADIRNLVNHLKNNNIGVLITDHNVREALNIIDRGYIINEGRVLMEGTPQEIISNNNVRKVYLGEEFKLK